MCSTRVARVFRWWDARGAAPSGLARGRPGGRCASRPELVGGPVLSFGNSSITCSIHRTHERLCSNTRANHDPPKGSQMAIIDIPADSRSSAVRATQKSQPPRARAQFGAAAPRPVRRVQRPAPSRPASRCGPIPRNRRADVAGVSSQPAHHADDDGPVGARRRRHHRVAGVGGPTRRGRWAPRPATPTELAVVQVKSGETLQQVARRVAPDAPVARVVEQIRDLNQLDSGGDRRRADAARPGWLSSAMSAESSWLPATLAGVGLSTYTPLHPAVSLPRATRVRSRALELVVRRHDEGAVMHCPFCRHPDSRVVDSARDRRGTGHPAPAVLP